MADLLPPLKPIAIKERLSILFIEKGHLDVLDGAFVVVDKSGVRTHIPVGGVACLMLEPVHGLPMLLWRWPRGGHTAGVGGRSGGAFVFVRSAGGARADRLLYQAKLALDDTLRLKVVRKMYAMRFGEVPPERRSVEQLRGIEGARVRETYKLIAKKYGVEWKARNYDTSEWDKADLPNRCLSSATSCLYGVTEAAVLAAGYAPAVGFIHTGKPLSFVYDVADIYKFETVVPVAFKIAATSPRNPEQQVRIACRDVFRESRLLERIIPGIEEMLSAGEIAPPVAHEEAVLPLFPMQKG